VEYELDIQIRWHQANLRPDSALEAAPCPHRAGARYPQLIYLKPRRGRRGTPCYGGGKMFANIEEVSQATRAVRRGLILTSGALVLLGFILTHNA
jgi:hypothetical protein